jgi:hypothetical protein
MARVAEELSKWLCDKWISGKYSTVKELIKSTAEPRRARETN